MTEKNIFLFVYSIYSNSVMLDVDFLTLSVLIGNSVFAYIHQYIGSVRLLLAISYTIKKDYRTIAKWDILTFVEL